VTNPMTTDEIVAARIRKYEADIGDPTRPGEKCPCTKCETARKIVAELQYIQMAARNLAPRLLTSGHETHAFNPEKTKT
jgi:hypothetical protein